MSHIQPNIHLSQRIKALYYVTFPEHSDTSSPIPVENINTLGNVIWERQSEGTYTGTLVGAFTQRPNKIQIFTGQTIGPGWQITVWATSDDTLSMNVNLSGVNHDNWNQIFLNLIIYK